jgi:peptidoglycan/xylan/chitin deacetylase (PgdA/CDA1 family)
MRRFVKPLLRPLALPACVLASLGLRLSRRRVGLALVYHRVEAQSGDPRRELVPPHAARLFEAQLRHVRRWYRVVPASELLAATRGRRLGQRLPVAITFDDDLACHRRFAAPVLTRLGLPAVFFLSGASLAEPFSFWWERLQRAIDRGVPVPVAAGPEAQVDPYAIHDAAAVIEQMAPEERDAVSGELEARLGPDPGDAGMRAEDVRALAGAGFQIGFHTLRHDALTRLDDVRLERALVDGASRLESLVGRRLTMIGYPHGKADERVAAAARAAGFDLGFTLRHEPVRPDTNPLLLGRLEPSFTSVRQFAVQVVRLLLGRT